MVGPRVPLLPLKWVHEVLLGPMKLRRGSGLHEFHKLSQIEHLPQIRSLLICTTPSRILSPLLDFTSPCGIQALCLAVSLSGEIVYL